MGKKIRKVIQAASGLLSNGYLKGFVTGRIYQGKLKHVCVPGMNCYSCPGALGACPIGAMQAVIAGRQRKFPLYVFGFLATVGLLVGRFICGWLCLFGLLQELLYRIPTPKIKVPEKADRILRYLKYAVLLLLVIGLPFAVRDAFGLGEPFFCKYLCPVGTLEGGVPLVLLQKGLRRTLGWLFAWKFVLLLLCIASSVFIYRPFCKYICPLGAFYALFQKVSILRLALNDTACVHCGACARKCAMQVDPSHTPNSAECIRCGECVEVCPEGALQFGVLGKKKTEQTPAEKTGGKHRERRI